ncbi:hypothetical protein LCGC14_2847580, partial [marine sediment metagenome]
MKKVRELVIFIAGSYRASTNEGVLRNIRNAEGTAFETWFTGVGAVICPHLNCKQSWDGPISIDRILEGDKLLLSKCDAVRVVNAPNITLSEGTMNEIELAKTLNIPVLYTKLELYD